LGVKRSILSDRRGMPLGLAISGANTHDQKLLDATLDSVHVPRPPRGRRRQHLCLDKGYDCDAIRQRVRRRGYTPHIRTRGEEQSEQRMRGKRPRRWVVERVASWLNRYRRILVRWEKKAANYEALLHLVFAHILWRNS
jgi:putative transposase